MTRIENSIDIDAPIEAVFAAVTDPSRGLEWNPSLIDVTDIVGIPSGVGTSWTQVASYAGRTVSLNCRIVEYNPPHEGVLDVTGAYAGRIVTLCERVGDRTRLVQAIEFEPPAGIAGRIAVAVIQPAIRREIDRTLSRQQEILELEAGGNSGSRTG